MPGLHPQSRRKAERRSVDMAQPADDPGPAWQRPPPEECEDDDPLTIAPTGADPALHRVKVRVYSHASTRRIVEFAVVQQTFDRGRWRDVVSIDSCHDVDVHLHRYSRRTGERTGEPEVLLAVASEDDVQEGYNVAYDLIEQAWSENIARWHDA